jgi:hypothetical protein
MPFDLRFPDVLRSTDFKVFEAIYKIIFGSIKKDVDGITDLKNVERCAEHMLPLLAGSVGCDYFSDTTPAVNRLIIKNWWWLMKNKGTLSAIQTAASLGLIAYDNTRANVSGTIMYGRTVELVIDKTTGEIFIRIAYQELSESTSEDESKQLQWMQRMVEYVRPAGFIISFTPSKFTRAFINAITNHDVRIVKMTYNVNQHSSMLEDLYVMYDIVESSIPEACVSKFGHYSDKDDPSNPCLVIGEGECPYRTECKAFIESGMGQTEVSGLDGVERFEPEE